MKPTWPNLVLVCCLCILNACGGASGAGTPQPVATHFSITSQVNVAAGTAFKITVTALDASNNTVSTYSGTVRFTSSDAQAVLPGASRLTNGAGTFSVTLLTPGSQTITATDSNSSSITGTTRVNVLDSATTFFVTAPLSSTAGFAFSISVTATDAASQTVTSYTGTIHFTSSDGKALLPPDSTLTNGTGTFPVTLNSLGVQTITATDTSTASITGTSSSVTVVTNAATHLSVGGFPGWSPGNPMRFTVTALDAANNASAGYAGTVHFTSTDALALLPPNSMLTNGTANFSATLNTIGQQTITATDTVTVSIAGTSRSINVAKLTISGTPPNGAVGVQYSSATQNCTQQPGYVLQASGGWAYHGLYSFSSSSLPPGLQIGQFAQGVDPGCFPGLPPEWILYGSPTQAGTFNNVVITVKDNEPLTASATYTITIAAAGNTSAKALSSGATSSAHHHYKPIDVGTFGGPSSYLSALFTLFGSANVINKDGTFAGWADTPASDPFPALCFFDCYVSHALQWHDGASTDLGSLANGWSSAALWINNQGEIVGVSQNGVTDPVVGFPEERAVVWRDGQILDLGTLGGNQSFAGVINNHGQVAGLALSDVPDSVSFYYQAFFCQTPFQVCPPNPTATRAFVWDEKDGIQDLGTLGGPDAAAILMNDRGQVAGFAYTNATVNAATGFPTFHPFLWEKGKGMKDLGTLGGTVAQAVNGINESGEVVGSTTMAGDQTHHPFLWDGKRLTDLGTFGGDNGEADWINEAGDVVGIAQKPTFCPNGNGGDAFLWRNGVLHDLGTTAGVENSEADFINSKGQVVGYSFSCDFSIATDAFLWENSSIVDLNTLIPANSGFYLAAAEFISDRGEIAALGSLPSGDSRVVLLIPCDENHPDVEGCDYSMADPDAATSARPTLRPATSGELPLSLRSHRSHWFRFPASGREN